MTTKKVVKKLSVFDDLEDFRQIGDGVFLYFYLIKYLAFVFLFISLLALAPIIFNYSGTGLKFNDSSNFFGMTTIGNIQNP